MNKISSFRPILANNPKVLILGSMPGEKSLEMQQYYAHPQNSFWFILGEILGFDPSISYEERTEILRQNGVCLWDVLKTCVREGSLDSAIKNTSVVTNDFCDFLIKHNEINNIFFNGAKAEQLFCKHIQSKLDIHHLTPILCRLPSTSPAHASMAKNKKLEEWQIIKQCLLNSSTSER